MFVFFATLVVSLAFGFWFLYRCAAGIYRQSREDVDLRLEQMYVKHRLDDLVSRNED